MGEIDYFREIFWFGFFVYLCFGVFSYRFQFPLSIAPLWQTMMFADKNWQNQKEQKGQKRPVHLHVLSLIKRMNLYIAECLHVSPV